MHLYSNPWGAGFILRVCLKISLIYGHSAAAYFADHNLIMFADVFIWYDLFF